MRTDRHCITSIVIKEEGKIPPIKNKKKKKKSIQQILAEISQ